MRETLKNALVWRLCALVALVCLLVLLMRTTQAIGDSTQDFGITCLEWGDVGMADYQVGAYKVTMVSGEVRYIDQPFAILNKCE